MLAKHTTWSVNFSRVIVLKLVLACTEFRFRGSPKCWPIALEQALIWCQERWYEKHKNDKEIPLAK